MPTERLHTCMLCEATCGLVLELEGDRVTRVRGDPDDPSSKGYICPKAAAITDVMEDPDRVRSPLIRGPAGLREASWEEALGEAGRRIAELQARHGPHAVGLYLGNPTIHSHGAVLGVLGLTAGLQGRSNFSATSVDQLPHQLASYAMFGHQFLIPVPDVDHTQLFVVIGANPLASNGSLMTAPGMRDRLRALKARGGRLVVVDPRRTETAELADLHLAIQPGTDALLLLAILHVITREGLARPGRLADFTRDLSRVGAIAEPFSPERVAARTRLEPEQIRSLAREIAASDRAAVYGRMGTSTQATGGASAWLLHLIAVVTGSLDRPGGLMFTAPAVDLLALASRVGRRGSFGRFSTRVRGLPEFGGEQPVAALAEEMDTPGDRQIRGLITCAGNPVLSAPNGRRLERALERAELVISVDLYRNETTRHAHVILPTTFGFERDHYDLVLNLLAVRNTARFAEAAVRPAGLTRDDFDVLLSLGAAIARARPGPRAKARAVALEATRRLGARRALDALLRLGPHGLSLESLLATPHGRDLGPLGPRLPAALATEDGKIHAIPALFERDLPRLRAMLEAVPEEGLVLIGRRQLRGNNSWMHNAHRLTKGKPACTLLMHPADAERRGLSDGATVELASATGRVEVPLELSDAMKPGVVSLPHGYGHARPGVELSVARALPGASMNDVTDEDLVDPLSATAILNGIPVDVRPSPR